MGVCQNFNYCSYSICLRLAINVTTIIDVKFEFDPDKNQHNIVRRGFGFDLVSRFDFDDVLEVEQVVDGEWRNFALGYIDGRLYALVYTLRGGDVVRVISLRKANKREVKRYEQAN